MNHSTASGAESFNSVKFILLHDGGFAPFYDRNSFASVYPYKSFVLSRFESSKNLLYGEIECPFRFLMDFTG